METVKPSLVILAAGMGSRYGGLKQMDPVGPGGEAILDYSIHDAARAGFGKAVFVIRPDFAELFKQELGRHFEKKIAVDYVYQNVSGVPAWFTVPEGREKPWGTGHAVLAAREAVQEPFAMINADDFYGQQGFEVMARHLEQCEDGAKAAYSMVGYELSATLSEHGTVSRGICQLDPRGNLETVVETLKIEKQSVGARDQASGAVFTGRETVSMNFFGFTPSIFGHLQSAFDAFLRSGSPEQLLKGELYIPKVVDSLIQSQNAEVKVLRSSDSWFGITYRDDKPRVQESILALVRAGKYPERLRG
jgi:dTDP-glucose pyrophosphorylase